MRFPCAMPNHREETCPLCGTMFHPCPWVPSFHESAIVNHLSEQCWLNTDLLT